MRRAGLRQKAIAAFTQALQLDPNLAAAHNNLGIPQQGQQEEADAIYQKAKDLDKK